MRSWSLDLPAWSGGGGAEAWARLGDAEQVSARAGAAGPAGRRGVPRAGCGTAVAGGGGAGGTRARLLAEAVGVLERREDRYELARALTDQAAAQAAAHRKKLAKVTAQRALDLARACGAKAVCLEAARVIDAVEPRRCSEDAMLSLTKAEQRVASLAASGYKNREIAERLFVTVSTVEQHLTRVFRKLNVRQRNELPISLMRTA
ncbi:helix-turn-helix transcriptional regulator [Lentzea guizhouensis]|uniref:helix-turn-helix transcriptional regulator n=1 Tax=Lentzea guizhouensis TaxID=1586287 RepID=UPI0012B68D9A|nr:helix-turn-helix transcriptional regulator [Lentzea guizhouensis]